VTSPSFSGSPSLGSRTFTVARSWNHCVGSFGLARFTSHASAEWYVGCEHDRARAREPRRVLSAVGSAAELAVGHTGVPDARPVIGSLRLEGLRIRAAVGLRKLIGASPDWHERELTEKLVARLRLALGEESYAEAAAAGEAAPDQTVEQVLEGSASTLTE